MAWATDADFDASYCELWVNALGRGQWSHNGTTLGWLEAYLRLGNTSGTILGAGLWARHHDAAGVEGQTWSYGTALEPGYYRTGLTTARSGPGGPAVSLTVDELAFFIDVQRPSGAVERLWQSNGGNNFTVDAAYPTPGFVLGIGSGSVEYAPDASPVLASKWSCQ